MFGRACNAVDGAEAGSFSVVFGLTPAMSPPHAYDMASLQTIPERQRQLANATAARFQDRSAVKAANCPSMNAN